MEQRSFDFNKYAIKTRVQNYITDREKILFKNFKGYSDRLYNICKALSEIKFILKKETSSEVTFVEWYKFRGFNKDKVSELTKRYELYQLAPDLKEYISGLSIPAVKMLTKKNVDVELREEILLLQPRTTEEVAKLLNKEETSETKKHELVNPEIKRTYNFFKKKVSKAASPGDLVATKKDLIQMKKMLVELEKDILAKEKEYENKNNLKLVNL